MIIQFAHDWDDWHVTSLHLFKLVFEERQISIRPSLDDVRDLMLSCSTFAVRSAALGGFRRRTRCFLQKLDKWRYSVLNSEMLFNSRAPSATIVQSQFDVFDELSQRFGQRHCILGRNEQTGFAMDNGFRNSSQPGGHDRTRSRHRLDDHGWKNIAGPLSVCHRSERENISSLEFLPKCSLRQWTEPVNSVRQLQLSNSCFEIAA